MPSRFGRLDVSVLNAGIGQQGKMFGDLDAYVPLWHHYTPTMELLYTYYGSTVQLKCFGRLDVSVLNAGIGEQGNVFGDLDATAWKLAVDVNLSAVVVGMRLSAYHMKKKHGGTIITVASASGKSLT
eukprot:gene16245-22415_t